MPQPFMTLKGICAGCLVIIIEYSMDQVWDIWWQSLKSSWVVSCKCTHEKSV